MLAMGVGMGADPIEAPGLQMFSGVTAATAIAIGGSAEIVAITTIGIVIATGGTAGKRS